MEQSAIMEQIRGYCDKNEIRLSDFLESALLEAKTPPLPEPKPEVITKTKGVYREKKPKAGNGSAPKEEFEPGECHLFGSEDVGWAERFAAASYNAALRNLPKSSHRPEIISAWMMSAALFYAGRCIRGLDQVEVSISNSAVGEFEVRIADE